MRFALVAFLLIPDVQHVSILFVLFFAPELQHSAQNFQSADYKLQNPRASKLQNAMVV